MTPLLRSQVALVGAGELRLDQREPKLRDFILALALMRLGEAAKLMLLSFDSTLRSNLSVGMPLDILVYERDSLDVRREKRIGADDEYFRKMSQAWSDALRQAFAKIEEFKV